jgi:hypothetical protein
MWRLTIPRRFAPRAGVATATATATATTRTSTRTRTRGCPSTQQIMSFHFASSEYAASFLDLPDPDTNAIRASAVEYLDAFDPQSWYNDPVRST